MKFRVSFKTPDVLDYALQEHMDTHCEKCEDHNQYCDACLDLEESSCAKIQEIKGCAEKFIEYGECITIEFDTDAKTATVMSIR